MTKELLVLDQNFTFMPHNRILIVCELDEPITLVEGNAEQDFPSGVTLMILCEKEEE